jgi:hypothetical protein
MSCENLEEVKIWYQDDRSVLQQKECQVYMACMKELELDSVQIAAFFLSIQR